MKILVAEDSGVIARVLRRALESLGHECLHAADGLVAWQLFQDHSPDVVISDWIMPGIEGPELCRRVRAADRAYTYFILLTVLGEKQNALLGMRAGADDYLVKPVDLDELQLRLIAAERVTSLHRQLATQTAERARAEEQLREAEKEQQRHAFLGELALAEERLRQQVAELLHGRVQSRLVVAWHQLGQCEQLWDAEPARARVILTEAKELIDEIRDQDVRRASHLLHPFVVQLGLVPSVSSLVDLFQAQVPVSLLVDPRLAEMEDPAGPGIPEPIRLAAYRVVEESLGNVVRHAGAKSATVRIGVATDGSLALEVSDDGRGLDPRAVAPGLGLKSISARIDQVGGEWSLTGSPGRGARVTVRLPMTEMSARLVRPT